MHPQLQELIDEFERARDRLERLIVDLPPERFGARRVPDRWSAAECIAHLNLTADAMRAPILQGLDDARGLGGGAPARYRRDLLGWLIWRGSGEPATRRFKTTASFVPTGDLAPDRVVAEFRRLQDEQIGWVRAGDGLPLHRVKIVSVINPKLRYNLFAALTILPTHQHRHLRQAEDLWREDA